MKEKKKTTKKQLMEEIAELRRRVAELEALESSNREAKEEQAQLLLREQAARKEAEAVSRAKDEIIASISGERRPPLASILGWAKDIAAAPSDNRSMLDGLQVLLVEAEESTRSFITEVLEQRGASVKAVRSVAEAFDTLDRESPDVLVSSLKIQGEDGYAMIRKVRMRSPEKGGQIPAVAITPSAIVSEPWRALLAGFQTYVCRPINPAELVTTVTRLTRRDAKV